MDENLTAEERLKQLNEERKSLRDQVKSERTGRLEKAAAQRVGRDEKIEQVQVKLKKIQSAIYSYNKLGKVAKVDFDIFKKISEEINCPDEDIVAESEE